MGDTTGRRAAIAVMGQVFGPDVLDGVQRLFGDEQAALARAPGVADLAYGSDLRQRLDLYAPDGAAGAPVLLFVHGGGFVRGDKRSPDTPFNAHVGAWAARAGMVGAVMNYRLAPAHGWPAGGEDVGAAIDRLRTAVGSHGGDPDRIVAVGTSAGAVHVATHLRLCGADTGLCGAVLLSGLYGFTPLDDRDQAYYGPAATYPNRWPREAVIATTLPLLVAWAEYDPPRFQAEALGLLAARLDRHGRAPRAVCGIGHNHFSLSCHLGGADSHVSDVIAAFVADVTTGETP